MRPSLPSQIRERILRQHEELRRMLDRLEQATRMVLDRDDGFAPLLRQHASLLLAHLRAHIDLEDAILVPALREADAWGPSRAAELERHHREQRLALEATVASLTDPEVPCAELARTIVALVEDLRTDMRHEEKDYLHANILRDDVVGIDVEAG